MPVQRVAHLGPQRVAGAEPARQAAAGRHLGEQRVPQRRRGRARHEHLVAALAGVPGAAHRHRHVGRAAGDVEPALGEAHVPVADRQPDRGEDVVRPRALDGEHADVLVHVDDGDTVRRRGPQPPQHLGASSPRSAPGARRPRPQVDDEVVDDAAGRVVAAQRVLRLARARSSRARSSGRSRRRPRRPGRSRSALPRWLTSKRPTALRTASCSLSTPPPGYSMGISQPPKSASFAPRATCRSCERGAPQRGGVAERSASWTAKILAGRPCAPRGDLRRIASARAHPDPHDQGPRHRQGRRPRRRRRLRRRTVPGCSAPRRCPRRCAAASPARSPASGSPVPRTRSSGCPRAAAVAAPVVVAHRARGGRRPRARRRRPRRCAAPPVPRPARWPASATVALALPAADVEALAAVAEGALLGAYAFTRYRTGDRRQAGRRRRHRRQRPRPGAAPPRPPRARAEVLAAAVARDPRPGQHPAARPVPRGLRRRGGQAPSRACRRQGHRARREEAGPRRLRRPARRRHGLVAPAAAGPARLRPGRRDGARRARRQGHHLRLRRPVASSPPRAWRR